MPRVVCRYIDCVFLENGVCGAESILIDPDEGCLSYSSVTDPEIDSEWDELEELPEEEEEDEELFDDDEEEEDDWIDAGDLI